MFFNVPFLKKHDRPLGASSRWIKWRIDSVPSSLFAWPVRVDSTSWLDFTRLLSSSQANNNFKIQLTRRNKCCPFSFFWIRIHPKSKSCGRWRMMMNDGWRYDGRTLRKSRQVCYYRSWYQLWTLKHSNCLDLTLAKVYKVAGTLRSLRHRSKREQG